MKCQLTRMEESSDREFMKRIKKKWYKKPELRKYGRVNRVTAGGSGPMVEMMMMTAMMRDPFP